VDDISGSYKGQDSDNHPDDPIDERLFKICHSTQAMDTCLLAKVAET
jgi:hypothetical protein